MKNQLSRSTVWELIAPAVPDSLEDLGNGHFVAKWWKPVPVQDVENLLKVADIKIVRGPYEPRKLPEGLAVQFSVLQSSAVLSAEDNANLVELRTPNSLHLQKTGS